MKKTAILRKGVRNPTFDPYLDSSMNSESMTFEKLKEGLITLAREKNAANSYSAFTTQNRTNYVPGRYSKETRDGRYGGPI
jgi:hypothetical protein